MTDARKSCRERAFARARLPGSGTFCHVADVSPGGIKLRFTGRAPAGLESSGAAELSLPEEGIGPIRMRISARWVDEPDHPDRAGYAIDSFETAADEAEFRRLVEYYARCAGPEPEVTPGP